MLSGEILRLKRLHMTGLRFALSAIAMIRAGVMIADVRLSQKPVH